MPEACRWRELSALPRPSGDGVVAWRAGAPVDDATFARRVEAWRAALAGRPGARWVLWLEDSAEFAAALLGAWHAGKTVVLPGDARPGTLAELRATVDGFAGDLPGAVVAAAGDAAPAGAWPALPEQATHLVVHTSGTRGEPVAIEKRLGQLAAEVRALERRFGALCDTGLAPVNLDPDGDAGPGGAPGHDAHDEAGAHLVHGVAPAHLRPAVPRAVAARRRPRVRHAAAAVPGGHRGLRVRLGRAGDEPGAPAPAARGPRLVGRARGAARRVLVGRALARRGRRRHAGAAGRRAGGGVRQLRDGGVGWRQRARHGETWQPLPGVDIRVVDGLLAVRSPHLPDAAWWATADRAQPAADGVDGFELLGRADRVVKVEEKRVSLDAIERGLLATGLVVDARALLAAGETRLAAVAVLSEAGRQALAAGGKRVLGATLREALADSVERVALPRRWRFVEALPADAQGKVAESRLAELFSAGRPAPDWTLVEPLRATARIELDPGLAVFDGHFPGDPVLPGVAQVDWALRWGRERFAIDAPFRRIEALKFPQPLRPGASAECAWDWLPGSGTLRFELRSPAGVHASGRAVFGEAP